MEIRAFSAEDPIPWHLLLLADPDEDQIRTYWHPTRALVLLKDDGLVGILAWKEIEKGVGEICNIAIHPNQQGQGLGKLLLQAVETHSTTSHISEWQIATANSSIGQLALYQKQGFQLFEVVWNYFLEHYPEPIFEHGIQALHQMRLRKVL